MIGYSQAQLTREWLRDQLVALFACAFGAMVVVCVIGCYTASPMLAGYWMRALAMLLVPFMPAAFLALAYK